jgi:hypothetical protein
MPRVQMTPMVKVALVGISVYLVALFGLLVYRFVLGV